MKILPARLRSWPPPFPPRRRTIGEPPDQSDHHHSAGGLSDIFMRVLGEELRNGSASRRRGNRPGGAMNTGTRACADSAPDG